jgi:hypothetical protein
VRVLVTGSRTWTDASAVWRALNDVDRSSGEHLTIVHGACPNSPDMMAVEWAERRRGSIVEPHPADWDAHGPKAGFIRNKEMVDLGADLCLAFIARCVKLPCKRPGVHGSHGAVHCAHQAAAAGIPTIEYLRWGDAL